MKLLCIYLEIISKKQIYYLKLYGLPAKTGIFTKPQFMVFIQSSMGNSL